MDRKKKKRKKSTTVNKRAQRSTTAWAGIEEHGCLSLHPFSEVYGLCKRRHPITIFFFFWPPAAILHTPSRGPAPRRPPHRCLGSERKSTLDWKFQTVWPLLPVIFLGVCCPQETRNSSRLHCFPVFFFLNTIWLNVNHRKTEINLDPVISVILLYRKLNIDMVENKSKHNSS